MLKSFFKKATPTSRTIPFPAGYSPKHFDTENANQNGRSKKSFRKYPPNVINNSKYTMITLVPLVLIDQFKYFFNLYFLAIALSQLFQVLRIGDISTYFGPLGVVLFASLVKEFLEDLKRKKRDSETNSQLCSVFDPMTCVVRSVPSSKLSVGDFVLLEKNQRVPADVVLLRTPEKAGTCFIRTDQLDGETDWKLRIALPATQALGCNEDLCNLLAHIEAEPPSISIHSFFGSYSDEKHEQALPISCENMLWMNTILASDSALCMVVYTGIDTRAVMNSGPPKVKFGLLDAEINNITKALFFFTFVLSVAMVVLSPIKFGMLMALYFFRFLILFSSIIPINLRINLEVGKLFYSGFISRDKAIPNTIVRTSTIPEELGRINFLLTDKTGTLTKNEMEVKKIHTGTMSFNSESFSDVRLMISNTFQNRRKPSESNGGGAGVSSFTSGAQSVPSLSNNDPSSSSSSSSQNLPVSSSSSPVSAYFHHSRNNSYSANDRIRGATSLCTRVQDVLIAIALCHNVTPIIDDESITDEILMNAPVPDAAILKKKISYQAASPDEIALVQWASNMDVCLLRRELHYMRLLIADAVFLDVEILHTFPFTSESKRMGIIVRDFFTKEITFYEKGADAVMAKIVCYNDWLNEECENMAREGLRTLVIGRKRLSEDAYEAFHEKFSVANALMTKRNEEVAAVVQSHLEVDLELLGLTGVEDKLQDEIRPTLEILRSSGIRIWMLTGDKIETAKSIAVSSKLVPKPARFCTISGDDVKTPDAIIDRLQSCHFQQECCLVIDGAALAVCLEHFSARFLEVATAHNSVVCCRCSPTQKTAVTNLVRKQGKWRVACIGDGGNDVGMICAADVGIGIVGKEGRQASLASDFSITQFSHISRLLLWHGRNSYKRSAKLSQLIMHRGLIISIMQAVFSSVFYFAPIGLYQGLLLLGYTTFFTNFPIFFCIVFDHDVLPSTVIKFPELYKDLVRGKYLSAKTFCFWLLVSTLQGVLIMILALKLFEDDLRHIVSISFTALIFNELIMVAFEIISWRKRMLLTYVISIVCYVSSWKFIGDLDTQFMCTWNFWWKVLVITGVSGLPPNLLKKFRYMIAPPSYSKLGNNAQD